MSTSISDKDLKRMRDDVRELVRIVYDLERTFPERHFTLDGHLIGSIGEVLAAYYYAVDLYKASTEKHDGKADGREVQIKTTQRDVVLIGEEPDYLLVLYLKQDGSVYEVYNGPGHEPWEAGGKQDKRGYKHLRVKKLMDLDAEVDDANRILAKHDIPKMQKEFKNSKT